MTMDYGIRMDASVSGRSEREQQGSRRQQHQQKLRALVQALDREDLAEARAAYSSLLAFSPALAHSNFSRVGMALDSGHLALARRVIEEIYGQSQAIFKHAVAAPVLPPSPAAPMRRHAAESANHTRT